LFEERNNYFKYTQNNYFKYKRACSGLFYVIEFINYHISGNGVCQ